MFPIAHVLCLMQKNTKTGTPPLKEVETLLSTSYFGSTKHRTEHRTGHRCFENTAPTHRTDWCSPVRPGMVRLETLLRRVEFRIIQRTCDTP